MNEDQLFEQWLESNKPLYSLMDWATLKETLRKSFIAGRQSKELNQLSEWTFVIGDINLPPNGRVVQMAYIDRKGRPTVSIGWYSRDYRVWVDQFNPGKPKVIAYRYLNTDFPQIPAS